MFSAMCGADRVKRFWDNGVMPSVQFEVGPMQSRRLPAASNGRVYGYRTIRGRASTTTMTHGIERIITLHITLISHIVIYVA